MPSLDGLRIRFLCIPDVDKAIGGVKQIYRQVEHLVRNKVDAAVITEFDGFRPSWFVSNAPTLSLENANKLGEFSSVQTILVVPETYLTVNFASIRGFDLSALPRVVFNQNAYYSFGDLPFNSSNYLSGFYSGPNVLQTLSISEDTHRFLSVNLAMQDVNISRIVNSIEPLFAPDKNKSNVMHWMPRKNPNHVQAVLASLSQSSLANSAGWTGKPLEGLPHSLVADALNKAKIFLSFGHPEGFGLPVAEAMASGCWVIGYSGLGGRELFRFGGSHEITYGDWSSFVLAIQDAFNMFFSKPRQTSFILQRQSEIIRSLYSTQAEEISILSAWEYISKKYYNWLSLR